MTGDEALRVREGMNEALTKLMEIRDKLEEINRITGAMARL